MHQDIDLGFNIFFVLSKFIFNHFFNFFIVFGPKEETEYTKNIKLSKKEKHLLGLFFYKLDIIEMEFVINQVINYIETLITLIITPFIDFSINVIATICYLEFAVWLVVIVICLIYRFKRNGFKDKKDFYV